MAIFEGSRFINVYSYEEDYKGRRVTAFHTREVQAVDYGNAVEHTWIEGDRLDNLSQRYYGDPQYWWFLLDANPQYMEEHEILPGDRLQVPAFDELRKVVEDNGE